MMDPETGYNDEISCECKLLGTFIEENCTTVSQRKAAERWWAARSKRERYEQCPGNIRPDWPARRVHDTVDWCAFTGHERDTITRALFNHGILLDSSDCPVHSDPQGQPYTTGWCCDSYRDTGKHGPACGNYFELSPHDVAAMKEVA